MKTKTSFKKGHESVYHAKGKDHSQYKHGRGSTKERDPLYSKWSGMKRRCLNKNDKAYMRYGAKGVTVSKDWLDFESFLRDMGPTFKKGLSLDRIDNAKGYSKENCRWVTLDQQAKNKTTVALYTHKGLTLNASDWDRKLGFKEGTVRARIKIYKWPIEKALTVSKMDHKGFFKDNRGMYRVEIKRKGKKHFFGRYKTAEEAKLARDNFIASLL